MPSFNSSPRIRFTPHRRLSFTICWISAITSADNGGLLPVCLDLRCQIHLKSSRCQRSNVSGWMMSSACFQCANLLDNSTINQRSRLVNLGCFTLRFKTINCCRSRAFSATSSLLLHTKSAVVPSNWDELVSLVLAIIHFWVFCSNSELKRFSDANHVNMTLSSQTKP